MIEVTLQTRSDLPQVDVLADGYISKRWWPELRLDVSLQGMAADYYLFYAVKDASPYLQERFEEYAQVLTKQLAIYMDAAVGGELRHAKSGGLGLNSERSIARGEWRKRRQVEGRSLLEYGAVNFRNGKWKGGFGGRRWADIADMLIEHLRGNISAPLFVDLALALQHNTGSVFNKINTYWSQGKLKQVLDANLQEDWETLVSYGSAWARHLFFHWLEEEDTITVAGLEYSRPREVVIPTGIITSGCRIKVKDTARAKSVRGLEGVVLQVISLGGSSIECVVLIPGHPIKRMRGTSLISLNATDTSVSYEYIEES